MAMTLIVVVWLHICYFIVCLLSSEKVKTFPEQPPPPPYLISRNFLLMSCLLEMWHSISPRGRGG